VIKALRNEMGQSITILRRCLSILDSQNLSETWSDPFIRDKIYPYRDIIITVIVSITKCADYGDAIDKDTALII